MLKLLSLLVVFLVGCSQNLHENLRESGYSQGIFYQRFGDIGKDPIVILHGGPGLLDQTYLLPQMLELAKDYEVILYDQRGSGKSLHMEVSKKTVTLEQFIEDLEFLRKELKLEKINLLGHSWGGHLAMGYVIKYPQNVSHLVLLNSAPSDSKGHKVFFQEFQKRVAPIQSEITAFFSYDAFKKLNSDEIKALYKKLFSLYFYDQKKLKDLTLTLSSESAQSGFKVMEYMGETAQKEYNLKQKLKFVKVPTLIIHSKEDIIPYPMAEETHQAIPNSKLLVLDECDHFSYIEKSSETFSHIRDFLK